MTTTPTVRPVRTASATLLELFGRSVAEHADRPAVDDGEHRLNYAELAAAATAVGLELSRLGVRRGDRVACYLDRSVLTTVALLGILEAGAAYVAIDTSYPDERRELMLTDSAPAALVSSVALAGRFDPAVPVLHLDELPDLRSGPGEPAGPGGPAGRGGPARTGGPARPVENPQPASNDPAAVLFTSGSSGRPKPVLLTHANLVHFATNPALPQLRPDDRMAQVSSVSFDAFHYELWCALAAGAELVMLASLRELINADVQRELRRRQITVMLAPTMAVSHVLAEDRQAFNPLRVLTTGGDVLSPSTCRELFDGGFEGEFHNLYGPTEATTAATAYRVAPADGDAGSVPIGRPLAGVTARVLDQDLNPVPAGVVGELHLGGDGIAAGYLDRADLTAERFRTDPGTGARSYATGDLARFRPDGLLEFHGRSDDQVKVRGYRVELGEVERSLGAHPQVREVAVLTSGSGSDRFLVAVVAGYERLNPRELRDWAQDRLPEFEVPSSFVVTDAIPANQHGKRDLGRLRQLTQDEVSRRSAQAEPEGAVETYLAGLWEELLAVEQIGATDDFFDLGGNSLLAFRLQRRINRDLQAALQPKDVLVHSGLRELAGLIEKSQHEQRED